MIFWLGESILRSPKVLAGCGRFWSDRRKEKLNSRKKISIGSRKYLTRGKNIESSNKIFDSRIGLTSLRRSFRGWGNFFGGRETPFGGREKIFGGRNLFFGCRDLFFRGPGIFFGDQNFFFGFGNRFRRCGNVFPAWGIVLAGAEMRFRFGESFLGTRKLFSGGALMSRCCVVSIV